MRGSSLSPDASLLFSASAGGMWSFEEEESFLLFWYCATEAEPPSLLESAAARQSAMSAQVRREEALPADEVSRG